MRAASQPLVRAVARALRHRCASPLSALLLALPLVAGVAVAERAAAEGESARWRLRMATGRMMLASFIEPDDEAGDWLRIHLVGGGTVRVPAIHVRRAEELPLPPEEPAPVGCDPWTSDHVGRWDEIVETASSRHGLEANLVRAIIAVESCGNAKAVSPKGAVGLMQLMPATAAENGCSDRRDPEANVDAGCRHFARLLDRLDGDLDLALAAYNAGEAAVARAGGIPPYSETRNYVRKVKRHLDRVPRATRREANEVNERS